MYLFHDFSLVVKKERILLSYAMSILSELYHQPYPNATTPL